MNKILLESIRSTFIECLILIETISWTFLISGLKWEGVQVPIILPGIKLTMKTSVFLFEKLPLGQVRYGGRGI
jgi:hypothetical protein